MSSSSSSRQSSSQSSSTPALSTSSQSSSSSSSESLSSSTQVDPSISTSPSSSSSPTGSGSQSDFSTTLTSFSATNTGSSGSGGSLGNRAAVIATLTVFGVLSLILLMIFICCRRYQKNQVLQARARGRSEGVHRMASTVRRQRSCEKASPHSLTGEQRLDHTENGFVVQSLSEQPSDDGDDALDEIKNPHLTLECRPAFAVDDRDSGLEGALDRQSRLRGPLTQPHGQTATVNNPLVITPSRAYRPFPRWRRLPRPPSSSSVYPVILSPRGDKYSVRQLPIPMNIVCTETAAAPNQRPNRVATTRGPASSSYPMTPPNVEHSWGRADVSPANPDGEGSRQSYPPPIPQKNPLRMALSTHTMLNVQARESRAE